MEYSNNQAEIFLGVNKRRYLSGSLKEDKKGML
jgi:hypothetical protein